MVSELSYTDAEEINSALAEMKAADDASSVPQPEDSSWRAPAQNGVDLKRTIHIPAELLVMVFLEIQEGDGFAYWWRSISLVSSFWHRVACRAAVLWTNPSALYGPRLFRAALERSRMLPLDVNIQGPYSWCIEALDAVKPHADRIRGLAFGPQPGRHGFRNTPEVMDMSHLEFDVPNLTTLHIDLTYFPQQTQFVITHSRYPRLRELILEGATTPCDADAYAALTHLTLLDQHHIEGFEMTLDEFLALLRACRNLRELHIEKSGPNARKNRELAVRRYEPWNIVHFRRLRMLGLRDHDTNLVFLLTHIAYPSRTCVYMTSVFDDNVLPAMGFPGFHVTPSLQGVVAEVNVLRVIASFDFRIRLELFPKDTEFQWDYCNARSCIGVEVEGQEDPKRSLEVEWCIMSLTTSARRMFAGAQLKCLLIRGEYWDATGATWIHFFEAFPMLETIGIEDYERDNFDIYEALQTMNSQAPSQIACPNLKQFHIEGRWSRKLMKDVTTCFAFRKQHVGMLEELVIETNEPTIGLPMGLARRYDLSALLNVAQFVELRAGPPGRTRRVVRVHGQSNAGHASVVQFE